MIFPWQQAQWLQLQHAKAMHRLPHALLLSGLKGSGLTSFAHHFVQACLCEQCAEQPGKCDCQSSRLVTAGTHPNVLWITPEKAGHAIKVEQIREANDFAHQSSLQGTSRVVVIHPANAMNVNAANALLKTLEEPPAGTFMVLVHYQGTALPATIVSRCQRLSFPKPPTHQALAWLKEALQDEACDPMLLLNMAHGAPLAALALQKEKVLMLRQQLFDDLFALSQSQGDPLSCAANRQGMDLILLLDLMLSWMIDLLRLQLKSEASVIMHHDYQSSLHALTQRTSLQKNMHLMEWIQQTRTHINQGINLNKLLVIETAFIRWMECCHVSR